MFQNLDKSRTGQRIMGPYKGLILFFFSKTKIVKPIKEKQGYQASVTLLSDRLYQEKSSVLTHTRTHVPTVTENCSLHLCSELALVNLGKPQHLLYSVSVSGSVQWLGTNE